MPELQMGSRTQLMSEASKLPNQEGMFDAEAVEQAHPATLAKLLNYLTDNEAKKVEYNRFNATKQVVMFTGLTGFVGGLVIGALIAAVLIFPVNRSLDRQTAAIIDNTNTLKESASAAGILRAMQEKK